jgi:hypothetical protein
MQAEVVGDKNIMQVDICEDTIAVNLRILKRIFGIVKRRGLRRWAKPL